MNKIDLEAIRHNYQVFEEVRGVLRKLRPHNVDSLVNIEHGFSKRIDLYESRWCDEIKEHNKEAAGRLEKTKK